MWIINPEGRNHLTHVIADALTAHDSVKIEQTGDGDLAVTAWPTTTDQPATGTHTGVDLRVLEPYRPGKDDAARLVSILTLALNWQAYVLITNATDEHGDRWMIQTPPAPTDAHQD